ncbi:GNAT family N-acetyltransferase [Candidatus Bathyarchaeota archaeon]|nr:GNAT family N-acetyltransferase [Candidatus Bathyarchaeota archaeon]
MTVKPKITLRKARPEDKDKVVWVESKSTPGLSYVPHVWDMFIGDEEGDWSVTEIEGEVIGCGKYSVLPDGSVWLETLRVIPERQGLGAGKRLYEHWLELSRAKGVKTMRMYTGVRNVVSKGLAERYGLTLAETFHGQLMNSDPTYKHESSFHPVTDPGEATELLKPLGEKWGGWMVMNRTYYRWSPELCRWLAENGMVYRDPETLSTVVMGARFMKEYQLHIGLFDGDAAACLGFAKAQAAARGVKTLHCLYPEYCTEVEEALKDNGFRMEPSDFIVMEIHLS